VYFFKVSLKVGVFIFVLLIGIAASWIYIEIPSIRQELVHATSLIVALSGVYSAFYIGEGLRQKLKGDKIYNTYRFLEELDDMELIKIRTKLEKEFDHSNTTPADMYEKIVNNEDTHSAVKKLLNLFESISSGVQFGLFDEKVVHRELCGLLPHIVNVFSPYIFGHRQKLGSDVIYHDVEKLAGSWKSNKYLSSGESIDAID